MKTLADLKRDAKAGNIEGELVFRMGSTDIIERLRGRRKIIDANSVGITFLNNDGKKSELRIERAALLEYAGDKLTVFNPGYRELSDEEKAVMTAWEAINNTPQYQEQSRIDALSDGSSTYYQKKSFFEKRGKLYLMGYDEQAGLKYDHNTGKVRDKSIRGDIQMQYNIYRRA